MRYALLIYSDGSDASPDIFAEYGRYSQDVRESGAYVHGEPLDDAGKAKVVRERNGERLVTDGPFAETKEQLGGFYIVDAESEEEALDWAARIPSVRYGGAIEVRPIVDIPAEAMTG